MISKISYFALPELYRIKTEVLKKEQTPEMQSDKADRIIRFICMKKAITQGMVFSDTRIRSIIYCRHLIIYVIRQRTTLSLQKIGRIFQRDHSSIMHAITSIERYRATEPVKKEEIEKYLTAIY